MTERKGGAAQQAQPHVRLMITPSNGSAPNTTLHKLIVRPTTTLEQLIGDIRDSTSVLKQPVLLEVAGQKSEAFKRPEDFIALKHLKRDLGIALFLLMPENERLREWARKANLRVFESQNALDGAMQHRLLDGSRYVARTTGDLTPQSPGRTTQALVAIGPAQPGTRTTHHASLPSPLLAEQAATSLVREYVTGESLQNSLTTRNAPMEESLVLAIAGQILDVLVDLEQQDPPVVHGHIDPSHIIIDRTNRVHLIGFGASTGEDDEVRAPATDGYASPERHQGVIEPPSDWYALAVCMHRMLSNCDPASFPVHNYPNVRLLNPKVSPKTEQFIARALTYDAKLRYPSAWEMKRELEMIAGDEDVTPAPANSAPPTPLHMVALETEGRTQPFLSRKRVASEQQGTGSEASHRFPSPGSIWRSRRGRRAVVGVLLMLLLAGLLATLSLPRMMGHSSVPSMSLPGLGIGVIRAPDGEYIGLSDGNFAFDTGSDRPDAQLKIAASTFFRQGDIGRAETLWHSAAQLDTSDPEPLIYLEDQRVESSGYPWITLVVGTMDSGIYVGLGRDDLQGAYLVQHEYNAGFKLPGGMQVRLIIASTGNESQYAFPVARQIVRAAAVDHTLVGVMGWPYSSRTVDAVGVLTQAHIPMVSQMASSVELSGISRYFFRTVPPDSAQAQAGAYYVEHSLHAKAAALFFDPADAYSASIGLSFKAKFTSDGNRIVATEQYTVGKPETIPGALADGLAHNPDIIFFAGLAADASTLLTDLPSSGPFAHLLVMGGDGLYEVHSYSQAAAVNFPRLRFTAFAYPDEWGALGLSQREPAFFADYAAAFDPLHQHTADPYGFDRANGDAILSYDAVFVMVEAAKQVLLKTPGHITPDELRAALATITGPRAIQGVTGQIAFGQNGDAVNKAVVVLAVSAQGFVQMVGIAGQFLLK